ncbi:MULTISPECIES: hypothetical protein [Streptococcus]|jgi:hypothetical protein|uniref:Uncharacterized protein n=5 Tax=Streptococcus mitis TaxID=28037 RepID=A0A942XAB9_STRMT|nr:MULTISPECIES: hypothetical protein [Streptococcus]MBS4948785.1 hypothetical protein [Streptococcus mitis]MQP60186.1 hypothetical protein [Streptococcus mitis]MQP69587.1 hypothetical protein [Streptococcus mitis]MQP71335.1 hypothetical protein [Streptococcus mitis]MQP89365.1 hypothetical protein [Streptococcus mitis]
MRTPKIYNDLIKNKEITNKIIAECIYSVNKRAKNYRDKIEDYKQAGFYRYKENNIENAKEQKEKYYSMKEDLLLNFSPKLIHKQYAGEKRQRVYSYQKNYEKLYNEKRNDIVWENSYYDYDRNKEVEFFDYSLGEKKYLYFLYYEIGEYSFHTPITEERVEKNTQLEIKEIDENFQTHGADIVDLLSTQFVQKVIDLLDSGDYTIIE